MSDEITPENNTPPADDTAPPADGGGDTIIDGVGDDTPPVTTTWPEDWRNQLVGDDDKALERMGRFSDPKSLYTSYVNLEKKMASGDKSSKLKDDASEDEIKAYRADNGIPEEVGDYFKDMPDGVVIGDDDKERFTGVAEVLQANNVPPGVMHGLTEWYNKLQDTAAADQSETDKAAQLKNVDELRADWGAEFRANINNVNSFMKGSFPEGMGDDLMNARMPDGTVLGDNAAFIRTINDMARKVNPAASVVPNAGADAGQSIADELVKIKALMGDPKGEYWKGPKAEGHRKRYMELLTAQERMSKQG